MIVTVTMNPAIDKTSEVGSLTKGGLNRIIRSVYDAGGKGINVSKTIKALGGESIATGFLGGSSGRAIADALDSLGIDNDFVWTEGETRTNIKIVESSGGLTELNESGPFIPREKAEELVQKLETLAGKGDILVLSGSVPEGIDKDIYARIPKMAHKKGAAVLIDADGELFKNAVAALPDIVKPNRAELEEYAGLSRPSEEELITAAKGLIDKGIKAVALSMGENGAAILTKNRSVKCPALGVNVNSATGAGDAMVGALAYAFENRLSYEHTIRLCIAVSAGAVTTAGTKPPKKELVDKLMEQVNITYI